MSFLILDSGIVKVSEEGMSLPVVKELYAHDKTDGKKLFRDWITYIYFIYTKNGILDNILPTERKMMTCKEYLKDVDYRVFEKDKYVQKVVAEYIRLQYTPIEQLYEGIKTDIEELLKRLKDIRFTKVIPVNVNVDIPDSEGIMQSVKVKQDVEIDNSEEKSKAILLAEKLIDYEKKIRTKLLEESKEQRKKKQTGRLFDV